MSIYKSKKSPFYQYDFQIDGHRFHGSTQCTARKDAEKFEVLERERARALVKAMKHSAASLLIDDVAARLWNDEAQYDSAPEATSTNIARLVDYFGKMKPLTDIDNQEAKKMVAWRRGHRIKGRKNAAADRQRHRQPLGHQGLCSGCSPSPRLSGADIRPNEPKWRICCCPSRWSACASCRTTRQRHSTQASAPTTSRSLISSVPAVMRLTECVTLRWSEVNFGTSRLSASGRAARRVVFPITATVREILFPLQGQHPDFVFTYVAVYGNKRLGGCVASATR